MKKGVRIAMALLMTAVFTLPSFAQGPGRQKRMGHAMWRGQCLSLEMLDLSDTQREAIRHLESREKGAILEARRNLMVKRLELINQMRDPQASDASIKQASQELMEGRRLLHNRMVDYQLRIRKILSAAQIKNWCTMIGEHFHRGGWQGESRAR